MVADIKEVKKSDLLAKLHIQKRDIQKFLIGIEIKMKHATSTKEKARLTKLQSKFLAMLADVERKIKKLG